MDMEKRGLAIIYNPHNLYQFVWYYCNKGKEKKWDALCLPNGYKGEYMHIYCENTDIFQRIYRNDTDFSIMSITKKFRTFAGMFLYYIMGRRTAYCKKLINQYVNVDDYDTFVVISAVGVVAGACVALGKENEVIVLEDGSADYRARQRFISKKIMISGYLWQGFFLSLMGYCNPGWFRLKTDKYCIKYCGQPEKMIYRRYKEIRQLYTSEGTDMELFDSLVRKIYPSINHYDFDSVDVILMTGPLEDFVMDYEKYKKRIEKYIEGRYKSVLLKKHPREQGKYQFGNSVKVTEIDNSIPAEVILPYLKGIDIVMATPSSMMIYLRAYGLKCTTIYFDGMYEENMNSSTNYKYLSRWEYDEYCKKFASEYYQTIVL